MTWFNAYKIFLSSGIFLWIISIICGKIIISRHSDVDDITGIEDKIFTGVCIAFIIGTISLITAIVFRANTKTKEYHEFNGYNVEAIAEDMNADVHMKKSLEDGPYVKQTIIFGHERWDYYKYDNTEDAFDEKYKTKEIPGKNEQNA